MFSVLFFTEEEGSPGSSLFFIAPPAAEELSSPPSFFAGPPSTADELSSPTSFFADSPATALFFTSTPGSPSSPLCRAAAQTPGSRFTTGPPPDDEGSRVTAEPPPGEGRSIVTASSAMPSTSMGQSAPPGVLPAPRLLRCIFRVGFFFQFHSIFKTPLQLSLAMASFNR